MIILDSYVFRHKKSILMAYFGLGVTYDVINDNLVILWRLRDPKITTDYIVRGEMESRSGFLLMQMLELLQLLKTML